MHRQVSNCSLYLVTHSKSHPLTKYRRPAARNQLPVRSPLEKNRFVARTLAVGECADGLSRFVVEAVEHFVQLKGAEGKHEPFAVFGRVRWGSSGGQDGGMEDGTYMYGPGRSFMALKQRHVSSTRTGPLTCCVC